MKKVLLASLIAGALASGQANAFNDIVFDFNGAAAGGQQTISFFDWLPGNALSIGALSSGSGVPFTTVYQAKLGSAVKNEGGGGQTSFSPLAGTEFTIQASIVEVATGLGGSSASFTVMGGVINMFYDTTPDSNTITGGGYGDGTLILSASILNGTGAFNNATIGGNAELIPGSGITLCSLGIQTAGCTPVLLDGFGVDNQSGVLSHTGNGSSTINAHVDYQDSNFFRSILTTLEVGLNDTTNLADPFAQTNPSDTVVGVTPVYTNVGGARINGDANCRAGGLTEAGVAVARCDFHFQSDGATSFNSAPEPGALALLGLGLVGVAASRRRAKQQ
ncbi:MAG: PEP-CTERM sorting domain-containing protein [Dechloromonas sp.]|nr:PEP-CTERM sorting domain-containing protein [Dechloromonas sp.]